MWSLCVHVIGVCVRRWTRLCVHVIVGSLVCTCDFHLRAQVIVRLKRGLCVYMWSWFACADDPLTLVWCCRCCNRWLWWSHILLNLEPCFTFPWFVQHPLLLAVLKAVKFLLSFFFCSPQACPSELDIVGLACTLLCAWLCGVSPGIPDCFMSKWRVGVSPIVLLLVSMWWVLLLLWFLVVCHVRQACSWVVFLCCSQVGSMYVPSFARSFASNPFGCVIVRCSLRWIVKPCSVSLVSGSIGCETEHTQRSVGCSCSSCRPTCTYRHQWGLLLLFWDLPFVFGSVIGLSCWGKPNLANVCCRSTVDHQFILVEVYDHAHVWCSYYAVAVAWCCDRCNLQCWCCI